MLFLICFFTEVCAASLAIQNVYWVILGDMLLYLRWGKMPPGMLMESSLFIYIYLSLSESYCWWFRNPAPPGIYKYITGIFPLTSTGGYLQPEPSTQRESHICSQVGWWEVVGFQAPRLTGDLLTRSTTGVLQVGWWDGWSWMMGMNQRLIPRNHQQDLLNGPLNLSI